MYVPVAAHRHREVADGERHRPLPVARRRRHGVAEPGVGPGRRPAGRYDPWSAGVRARHRHRLCRAVVEPQARPAVDHHDVQARDGRLEGQDPRHAADDGRGVGAAVGRCGRGAERQQDDREQRTRGDPEEDTGPEAAAGDGGSPGHPHSVDGAGDRSQGEVDITRHIT